MSFHLEAKLLSYCCSSTQYLWSKASFSFCLMVNFSFGTPDNYCLILIKDSAGELRGVLNKKVTVFMFRLFQKWKEHHNNPSGDPSIGWTNANAMAANAAEAKKELTNYFSV